MNKGILVLWLLVGLVWLLFRLFAEKYACRKGFKLVKGCEASNLDGVHEGYSIRAVEGFSTFTINVSAENVGEVFLRLSELPKEPVFFLVEVGTNLDEEVKLRRKDTDPFHKDVYYLDGLSRKKALEIFSRYSEILIDDGGVTFGIGSHVTVPHDEVFVGWYKVFEIYTSDPQKYESTLNDLGFHKEAKLKTIRETFTEDSPGRANALYCAEKTIWQMIEELKKEGLYLAERRENGC